MAIPDGITKLTISGTLASGAEKWACSLYFTGYTEPPGAGSIDLPLWITEANWAAFIANVRASNGAGFKITAYDAYWYAGGEAVAVSHLDQNLAGTSVILQNPLQVATVLSLRTPLATRRGRGRIYVPYGVATTNSGTGRAPDPTRDAMVDNLAKSFAARKLAGVVEAVVVSQTGGFSTPISSVQCDDILDTQRRRRNKMVGTVHQFAV